MESTYKVYPNVKLGKNVSIGDYCIIGEPFEKNEMETTIGDNAIIRSHTVVYSGNKIGAKFTTGHAAFIQQNNKIGENSSLGTHSVILHDARIGNNVKIHTNSFIPEFTVIEDGVWVGPHVVITNVLHPLCKKSKECMRLRFVTIGKGAIIGANVTILPGVKIGEKAVIGAGSVVRDDVPPRTIMAGNLARALKSIDDIKCPIGLVEKPYG